MERRFQVGRWTVDPDLNSISCHGQTVHVEPKAIEVLLRLAASPGATVPKDDIIRSVWPDTFVGDDVLSRAVYELRKAFGDDPRQPQIIQTISKRGYRLIAPVENPEQKRAGLPRYSPLIIAAVSLVALGAGIALVVLPRVAGERSLMQSEIAPLDDGGSPLRVLSFALSPDGNRLALITGHGPYQLWERDLRDGSQHLLARAATLFSLFWSPDGKHLGYVADGRLKRMPVGGGPPEVLADAPYGWSGAAWGSSGEIVFSPGPEEGLYAVHDTGGSPRPVTSLPKAGRWSHSSPHFLPDGRTFLYASREVGKGGGGLYAATLDGGQPKLILEGVSTANYANGYLLHVKDGNLFARHFNPAKVSFDGNPRPVARVGAGGASGFSVSSTGILVYRSQQLPLSQFGWYSGEGRLLGTVGAAAAFPGTPAHWPSISPDDKKITVWLRTAEQNRGDLWLLDSRDGTLLQLTHASAVNGVAIFSPDGRKLAISIGNTCARLQLLFAPADGSHLEQAVLSDTSLCVMDWSRDGRYLIGDGSCGRSAYCIQYIDLQAGMKPIPVVKQSSATERPVLSPKGKWVAYNSRETGRDEVYVSAFPGPGRTLRISGSGGLMPEWSPDGTRLFYLRDPHTIMSARVTDASSFAFERPKVLFELGQEIVLFRVARGGDRFLVQTAAPSYSPLRLVVNWEKLMK